MISILMPIYNGIEYLSDSLSSVVSQTYTEWELLIGINGHPPNSDVFKIAEKYSSEKIFVVDFPDLKGKSVTLNEMLKISKYDVICLIDVDDLWTPDKLMLQLLYADKYDVIGTNFKYFGELDPTSKDLTPKLFMGEIKEEHFRLHNTIVNSSCMISRRNREIFWDGLWDGVEDYDLWVRLIRDGWSFFNVDKMLVKHRIHSDSFYNTKNKELSNRLKQERFGK